MKTVDSRNSKKFFQENTHSYRMDFRVWWSVDDNQMYPLGFRFDVPFRVLKWLEFGSSNFGHIFFKVSMNKTPVPPPVQLDHGWSRRLYPGDVQRVREADSIS